jgi:DNA repair exonuclease SbcCD ATPase subunit
MSVTQSTESTTSSLQRSGLSITVGDTKSIVLALQALQSKIRSLEQDRDYHQDQYEVSLQAHERYKLDMGRQMEQERAAHRKREAELLEMLRKAREERAELEVALNSNKEDLGGFRRELEEMIATEKELALQREEKLNTEVSKLRDDIQEEQTRRAALLVTIDKLKEEREAALHTNERLRIAMDDLLTRFEQLQQQQHRTPSSDPIRRGVSRSGGPAGSSVSTHGGAPPSTLRRGVSRSRVAAVSTRGHCAERPRAVVVTHRSSRHNYEDPTCSSMLRDVRVVPDEAPPCLYPSANSSTQQQQHSEELHSALDREGATSRLRSRHVSPPLGHRGVGVHSARHRVYNTVSAAIRSPSSQPQHASARRTAPSSRTFSPSTLRSTAMSEVEKQLRRELDELQRQYEDTVTRGAAEEIPSEVLAAALHRVSSLIDQKKEQVKLLREARRELEDAVNNSGGGGSGGAGVGEDKSTRRTMLVNELRSLLAEASSS